MVRSPHGEILAPQVQGARLVPKPEKMLRFLKIFPYPYPGVSSPVLALPAESALIRQQGLIRGNIVKIHLLLLRANADAEQGRLNDMNPGLIILGRISAPGAEYPGLTA